MPSNDPIVELSATDLATHITHGALSATEVMDAHLARIEELNPALNAIIRLDPAARENARVADAALRDGSATGPLHGVPFTVKDSFDTAGLSTTRGSKLFAEHVPDTDSTAVQRMRDAGAILLGKTNLPEFTLWTETENLLFGSTRNPHDLSLSPGGSSGGEAAAIAAHLSPLGLASDLSGSIRLPAHYCGIVGFKPTHGTVPLTGHWPRTLDRFAHVGPMARTVSDARLAFEVIRGPDGLDWYAEVPVAHEAPTPATGRLSVGVLGPQQFGGTDVETDAALHSAAEMFTARGHTVSDLQIPELALIDWDEMTEILYSVEGSAYFRAVIAGHQHQLHPVLRARLTAADNWDLARYVEVNDLVERLRRAVTAAIAPFHVLLAPVAPTAARPPGSPSFDVGGQQRRARSALRATLPFDLLGMPAISIPIASTITGLPIGAQLVGRKFDDLRLLSAAAAIEVFPLRSSHATPR
ncbi:amidase [Rhodococcus sp. NPDC057529]|uniref:amidase n=1 Tax=Rhodococcus sp. NPDC057529 TaxID=3346158 RepID=UPI0036711FD8